MANNIDPRSSYFEKISRFSEYTVNNYRDRMASPLTPMNESNYTLNEINRYNTQLRDNKKVTKSANQGVIQQFIKTKLCPYFKNNQCTNGSKCTYAHSLSELRPKPNLQNTKLCDQAKKNLLCMNPQCPYAHSKEELRPSENLKTYKTSLCLFFGKGICKNEEKCRFAHGESELRIPEENGTLIDENYNHDDNEPHNFETITTPQFSDHSDSLMSEVTINNEANPYHSNSNNDNRVSDEIYEKFIQDNHSLLHNIQRIDNHNSQIHLNGYKHDEIKPIGQPFSFNDRIFLPEKYTKQNNSNNNSLLHYGMTDSLREFINSTQNQSSSLPSYPSSISNDTHRCLNAHTLTNLESNPYQSSLLTGEPNFLPKSTETTESWLNQFFRRTNAYSMKSDSENEPTNISWKPNEDKFPSSYALPLLNNSKLDPSLTAHGNIQLLSSNNTNFPSTLYCGLIDPEFNKHDRLWDNNTKTKSSDQPNFQFSSHNLNTDDDFRYLGQSDNLNFVSNLNLNEENNPYMAYRSNWDSNTHSDIYSNNCTRQHPNYNLRFLNPINH